MSDYGTPPPPPPPGGGYQPAGGYGTPPPNYLVWAILSTLFCCLPLGVVSIVFAAQVNSKWASGDAAGALDSSKKAKNFAMWSAIAGVVVGILYVVFVIGIAALSNGSTSP
ncbi:Interferon-induced transmembrane protein [Pedococcus dokdonensis]|uniref:Interferon-induced transmembrane protein n=1 Tax=Pedococcus dokdonensis TaxID=443156 RepID=A0A1H0SSX3_9MICO|nr:CD225/dispanin family protein [Pedococcus dokdonensis]SDP44784.1 Interferon-induced transmembrane protein [Pedococcus dokdonensis]